MMRNIIVSGIMGVLLLNIGFLAFAGPDDDSIRELRIDSSDTTSPSQQFIMVVQLDDDISGVRLVQFDMIATPDLCQDGTVNVTFLGTWNGIKVFNEDPGDNPVAFLRVIGDKGADNAVDGPNDLVEISCTVNDLANSTTVDLEFDRIVLGDNGNNRIEDVSGEPKQINIVEGANQSPTCDDQNVTTTKNTPVDITLTCTDPEEDTLTFSIVDHPASGTLSGITPDTNTAQVTYTPNTDFVGNDSFTFRSNDTNSNSNTATVNITVEETPSAEKGNPDPSTPGTRLGDITLAIDIFLERVDPNADQLFAADVDPEIGDPRNIDPDTCGDGQIRLGDVVTLIDIFLERITVTQQCGA